MASTQFPTVTYGGSTSAYGNTPAGATPGSTASTATQEALNLGNQVYGQLPQYGQSLANIGSNIQSETAGELAPSVVRQIEQTAAERGIATGSPGGPNSNASLLQAIGLTSQAETAAGQQQLLAQLPALPGANISQNPNFYVSPQLQYESQLQNNILSAAPNPRAAAQANMAAAQAGLARGAGSFTGLPSATSIPGAAGGVAPVTQPGTVGVSAAPANISDMNQLVQKYSPTVTGNLYGNVDTKQTGGPSQTYIQGAGEAYDPYSDPYSDTFGLGADYTAGGDYYPEE